MTADPDALPIVTTPTTTAPRAELAAAVAALRDARAYGLAAKIEWDAAQAAFQQQHALTLGRHTRASAATREADERVRALALACFTLDKERHPEPGVELKRFDLVEYEEADASAWARDHELWWLFKLDSGAFEKMAKAAVAKAADDGGDRVPEGMPFVTVKEDWRPQIASVLP